MFLEAIEGTGLLEEEIKSEATYEKPSFEVLLFKTSDILTGSDGGGGGHPWVIPDDDDDDDDGPSW